MNRAILSAFLVTAAFGNSGAAAAAEPSAERQGSVPGAATPAGQQPSAEVVAKFDPDNPKYARINALSDAASDFADEADGKADTRAQVIARYAQLRDAARLVRLPDGTAHPLAAYASIKMASHLREDGKVAELIPLLEGALRDLRPFRSFYFRVFAEGTALLAQSRNDVGDLKGSLALLADGVAEYDKWFAQLPEAKKSRPTWVARSNMQFAYSQALSRSGDRKGAVEMQRATLQSRISGLGPNSPDTVSGYYWLASMLLQAEQVEEAEKNARHAMEVAIAHVDPRHPSYARAYEVLGLVLSRTGRREEGVRYLARALDVKKANGGDLYLAYGEHNLATILLEMERYADARPLFADAVKGFGKSQGASSPQALGSEGFSAQSTFALGSDRAAEAELEGVFSAMGKAGIKDPVLLQRVWPALILTKLDQGKTAEARQLAETWPSSIRGDDKAGRSMILQALALQGLAREPQAMATREAALRLVSDVDASRVIVADGQLTSDNRMSLEIALRIAVHSSDSELALRAMDLLARSRISSASRLVAKRLLAEDPKLQQAVRQVQDLARETQSLDGAVIAAWADAKDGREAQEKLKAAEARLNAARAELSETFPQWIAANTATPPTIAQLRQNLAKNEAMVGLIPAFEGFYILTVTADGSTIRRSTAGRAEIARLVGSLRSAIDLRQFDPAAAHALYRNLFSPVERTALKKAKTIKLVTSGPLASLPLSILLEKPVTELSSRSPWLLHRFAFTVAPDFTTRPQKGERLAASARFLGVGAPAPFGQPGKAAPQLLASRSYFRGATADVEALSSLPALPGAEAELKMVAQRFGTDHSTVLTGPQASEGRLKRAELGDYSVIMFATHGLVGGQSEGAAESALVLSPPSEGSDGQYDGLLTTSEIAALRLAADWVILSACNTAAGDTVNSEAYSGLSQAFLYAGARSLLVSHWPVRDDVASRLTLDTVSGANKGLGRAEALRRAQLNILKDSRLQDSAQPATWAPFVLLGN
ncbi:MAG: CHAT domain-containing protein [Novosphingobium sp.]